jgi:cytochrome c oxidase subunit 2
MSLAVFGDGGAGASAIAKLGVLLVIACILAYALLLAIGAWSMLRARRGAGSQAPARADEAADRPRGRVVVFTGVAVALALSVLVAASFRTDRVLAALEQPPAVQIEVTGHQWWWEIRYLDPEPGRGFVTANELHLPVGEPVAIRVQSADVIHSLWIPELAQKLDAIPGRSAQLHVVAQRAGRYPGRCSEFCGYQHAHMDLLAIAEPRAAFDAWRAAQVLASPPPATAEAARGAELFSANACISCHVIRGTPAYGYSAIAPDLTHLKSRATIAAGALPNTAQGLHDWIADPHRHKPGTRMPPVPMPEADRAALVSYLETLR